MPRQKRPRRPQASRPQLPKDKLRNYALRALARRRHATAELRKKMEERAADKAEVEGILQDLTEAGGLDDRRFALEYTRTRARYRRYGRFRIARELRQKGIPEGLANEALDEIFPTPREELALVRQRIEKRLARAQPPFTQKLLRSLYGSLLRAGFPSAIIRDELFQRPEFSNNRNSHSPPREETDETV